jgi:tetratricopeptide (TPR) repeat protein
MACNELNNAAESAWELGALAEAEQAATESYQLSTRLGMLGIASHAVEAQARVALARDRAADGLALLDEGIRRLQAIGGLQRRMAAQLLSTRVSLLVRLGRFEEAAAEATRAEPMAANGTLLPTVLAARAQAYLGLGRPALARDDAEKALESLRRASFMIDAGEAAVWVAVIATRTSMGDSAGATAALAEATGRLLEQAERISDADLRHSFLHVNPFNAELVRLATEAGLALPLTRSTA